MELNSTDKNTALYKLVHKPSSLLLSWRKVYDNAIKSSSLETKREAIEFNSNATSKISTLARKLREKRFKFLPAEGIPIRKKGKATYRPIVKAPIPNRIVQRRLLDILKELPEIQRFFQVESSFGGIEGRSVRDAVSVAYSYITRGYTHYIRSDISDFFSNIPRERVLNIITSEINEDQEFIDLLNEAVNTELNNLPELHTLKGLFPLGEIGVAQGCCLSPLMGNILLSDFDIKMNGRGIVCLRYIDDFIILGPSSQKVRRAFDSAQKMLNDYGLKAYDPFMNSSKAEYGETGRGFIFLGCHIQPGLISPSKESKKNVINRVDEILERGIRNLPHISAPTHKRSSLISILTDIDNVLTGWGHQYAFCNNRNVMAQLDAEIDMRISNLLNNYSRIKEELSDDPLNKRRLLGVHVLCDSKYDPIIQTP